MDPKQERKTSTFVISAPSGTGKTTLNRRLTREIPDLEISVSYTTRAQRPGEEDGVHYHFISTEAFQELVRAGKMLEFANVFGTLYGTAFDEIRRIEALGKRVILEIDVQGWSQARTKLADALAIFILPPSIKVLWERLSARGTESLDKRWKRLETAKSELLSAKLYDIFIVNQDLETAFGELKSVVVSGHYSAPKKEFSQKLILDWHQGMAHCERLLKEFDEPWMEDIAMQVNHMKAQK